MKVTPKSLVTMLTSVFKSPGKVKVFTMVPTIISSSECLLADYALESRAKFNNILVQILGAFNLI